MSSERQRRECCGSKGSWQTVPDVWASDRKTPHPQCCRHPWHEQCPGVRRPEMSLTGIWHVALKTGDSACDHASMVCVCVCVCVIGVVECSERYGYRCESGVCVRTGSWCDGTVDCPDASDERQEKCRQQGTRSTGDNTFGSVRVCACVSV